MKSAFLIKVYVRRAQLLSLASEATSTCTEFGVGGVSCTYRAKSNVAKSATGYLYRT